MPRKRHIPPFVPLPWISDPEETSVPAVTSVHIQELRDCHEEEEPHNEVDNDPQLHGNPQPVGVHPGLHVHPPSLHHEQQHTDHHIPLHEHHHGQDIFLPPQLRLPIDAARASHLPSCSQDPSSSSPIPPSSLPSFDSEPSSDPSYSEDYEEGHDFSRIVEEFVKEWLLVELTHNVSKTATDTFWRLALKYIPQLQDYITQGNKILQFQQLRKKLYSTYAPDVSMCVTFQNHTTHATHELQNIISIPKTRFPQNEFKRLLETAKVKVI